MVIRPACRVGPEIVKQCVGDGSGPSHGEDFIVWLERDILKWAVPAIRVVLLHIVRTEEELVLALREIETTVVLVP